MAFTVRCYGKICKKIFFFQRNNPYSNSSEQITGKRCNLGDGEGMLTQPIWIDQIFQIFKQEQTKMKEIQNFAKQVFLISSFPI